MKFLQGLIVFVCSLILILGIALSGWGVYTISQPDPVPVIVEVTRMVAEKVEVVKTEIVEVVITTTPQPAISQPYPAPTDAPTQVPTAVPSPTPTMRPCVNYPFVTARSGNKIQGGALRPGQEMTVLYATFYNYPGIDACVWDGYRLRTVEDLPQEFPIVDVNTGAPVDIIYPGDEIRMEIFRDVLYDTMILEIELVDASGNPVPFIPDDNAFTTVGGTLKYTIEIIQPNFIIPGINGGRYGGSTDCGPLG